jgi:hypothetical protein
MAINSAAIFQTLTEMLRSQERRDATNKSLGLQAINMAYERDEDLKRIAIAEDAQTQTETYQAGLLANQQTELDLKKSELSLTERQIEVSEGTLDIQKQKYFDDAQTTSQLLIGAEEEEVGKEFYSRFLSGPITNAFAGYLSDNDAVANQQNPLAKWDWAEGRQNFRDMLGDIPSSDKDAIVNNTIEYLSMGKENPKLIADVARTIKKNVGSGAINAVPTVKNEAGNMVYDENSREWKRYNNWIIGLGNAGIIYGLEPDKVGFGKRVGFGKDDYSKYTGEDFSEELDYAMSNFDTAFESLENIETARQFVAIEGMQARLYGDYTTDVDIISLLEGGQSFLDAGGAKPLTIQSSLAPYKPGSDDYFDALGEQLFTTDALGQNLQQKYGFSYNKEDGAYDFNLEGVDFDPKLYQNSDMPYPESSMYEDISGDLQALNTRIEVLNNIQGDTLKNIKINTANPQYVLTEKGQDDYVLYEVGKAIEVLENQVNMLDIKKTELEPVYLQQQELQSATQKKK